MMARRRLRFEMLDNRQLLTSLIGDGVSDSSGGEAVNLADGQPQVSQDESQSENSSCWIRVSQVHAGAGGIDLPRIGDEVIVDFLEGDPDRP